MIPLRTVTTFGVAVAALFAAGCGGSPPPPGASAAAGAAACDATRTTPTAPESYLALSAPPLDGPADLERGQALFESEARPVPCASCHGVDGDGRGPGGRHLRPPPTDFTCPGLIEGLSDGQLFWVIENGSGVALDEEPGHARPSVRRPGRRDGAVGMPAHRYHLSDEEIWLLVAYVRALSQ